MSRADGRVISEDGPSTGRSGNPACAGGLGIEKPDANGRNVVEKTALTLLNSCMISTLLALALA